MLLLTESFRDYCVRECVYALISFNWIIKRQGAKLLQSSAIDGMDRKCATKYTDPLHFIVMSNVQEQTKCKRYTNSLMSRDLLSDATCHMPYECNKHIHTIAHHTNRGRKRGGAAREAEAMSVSVDFLLLDD